MNGRWVFLILLGLFALWTMFFSKRREESRKFWLSIAIAVVVFVVLVAGIGALIFNV